MSSLPRRSRRVSAEAAGIAALGLGIAPPEVVAPDPSRVDAVWDRILQHRLSVGRGLHDALVRVRLLRARFLRSRLLRSRLFQDRLLPGRHQHRGRDGRHAGRPAWLTEARGLGQEAPQRSSYAPGRGVPGPRRTT